MSAPGRYRRQLVRNTLASGAANGWTIVLTIVTLPVLLDGLGTEVFGTWALLQTFSALTGWLSLADLGIGVATTRAVADASSVGDADRSRIATVTGLGLVGAVAAVCALALAGLGPLVLPTLFSTPDGLVDDLQVAIVIFSVQVACELVAAQVGAGLDGLQRLDLSRGLESVRRTLVLGAAAVAATTAGTLPAVVAASAAAATCALGLSLVVLWRTAGGLRARPSREVARHLSHDGRSIWLLSGSGVLHRTMDRLIVGAVLGPSAVTLVEVATQVQNGVMALLSASAHTVTSSSAWIRARADAERLAELLVRGTRYACLATVPVAVAVGLLAPDLIEVWVGPAQSDAAGLVALALLYLVAQAPLVAGSNMLVGIGHAREVLRPALLALGVNLVGSLVLVQTHGIAGVFVATVASAVVLSPLLLRAVTRSTGVGAAVLAREGVWPCVVPTVAVAVVAGGARLTDLAPWPTILLGGGLAALTWLATGARAVGADERRELLAVFSRS